MIRRDFFRMFAALGFAQAPRVSAGTPDDFPSDANAYFLDPGDLGETETRSIEEFIGYREAVLNGARAVMPRGGPPARAPTFNLLHWPGDIGSDATQLASPLGVQANLSAAPAYAINAQILGMRCGSRDWRDKDQGTVIIELRSRIRGEPVTWMFAQQFETAKGATTIAQEFIAERDGAPVPAVTDEPFIEVRIHLMREKRRLRILRDILRISSMVLSLALGGAPGAAALLAPPMRVPRMLKEGVAFSQAVLATITKDTPVWRSAFTPYSIATRGSRLSLVPGLWVVTDESITSQGLRLSDLALSDTGGRLALTASGAVVDANQLVLDLSIEPTDIESLLQHGGVAPKSI